MPQLNNNRRQGLDLVGLFFAVLSLVVTGLLAASRNAFTEPPAISFYFAWIHCAAVIFVWQITVLKLRISYSLAILATVATIALPCLAGNSAVLSWTIFLVLLLICAFGIIEILPSIRRAGIWQGIAVLCGAPLLAIVLFLWVNTLKYANVFEPEMALLGLLHVDTLYHTAISSMLTQHGVVSTGLDGLVHTPYHALSHLWIGRLSGWLHTTPIHGYYLVVQIIGIPLLLFSLVITTAKFSGDIDLRIGKFPEVLFVPLSVLLYVAIGDWNSYLDSESHTLGMLLFTLGLPLLTEQARENFGHNAALRLLVIIFLGLLMTLSKVSVGAIWFGGLGYVLLRHFLAQSLPTKQILRFISAGVVVSFIILPILLMVLPQDHLHQLKLAPLQFAKEEWVISTVNSVTIVIGLMLVGFALKNKGVNVSFEMLGIQMAAAWIITMLIELPGGSAYYFLNVGTWVAIVVIANWLLRRIDFRTAKIYHVVLICMIAIPIVLNSKITRGYSRMRGMVTLLAERVIAPVPPFIFVTSAIAEKIPNVEGAKLIQSIFRQFSYGEKNALIFVPPSNHAYWGLYQDCRRKALLIPSLTGIPLINGLPPSDTGCAAIDTHGYSQYSTSSIAIEMNDELLCSKAQQLNYHRIGILSSPMDIRLLNCNFTGKP